MKEIWVPEAIAVVFLALPFFRPFAKSLKPLDGLDWLPVLALAMLACIFPAYGFRPECLPMLAVALCINALHFFLRHKALYRRYSPPLAVLSLALLTAAAIPMFAFSPRVHTGRNEAAAPLRTLKAGGPGKGYTLLVYETAPQDAFDAARPLVFLIPPDIGSADSVDLVCRELLDNGFTAVTYYRDSPSSLVSAKLWRTYRKAAELSAANEHGKALEAERRLDIEYLLPLLPSLLGRRGNLPPLVLVGYGAGGSALAYMAGENRLGFLYGNMLGAVCVEGRLWSSYQAEARPSPEIPASAGILRRQWFALASRMQNMQPRKVVREGALPASGLPVLYLISGRALDAGKGQQPYRAVFDALLHGSGPVALAAVESAGPLDYQDYPLTRPVYSFLLPGRGATSESPVADTAAIIGNFAVFLLERAREGTKVEEGTGEDPDALEAGTAVAESTGEDPYAPPPRIRYTPPPPPPLPPRQPVNASLHFESKGLPSFRP